MDPTLKIINKASKQIISINQLIPFDNINPFSQIMKLYSPSNNYKLDKILLASKILNNPIEHIEVPFDHKHKQFIAQFPNYTLPALQLSESNYVFGSNSILLNIFSQKISKTEPFIQAQIHQWLETLQKQVDTSVGLLIINKQKSQKQQINQQQVKKAKQAVQKFMKIVDQKLKLRTYLCDHSISAADIAVFCTLRVIKDQFDEKEWKNLVCLKRWMNNLQGVWEHLIGK